MLLLNPPENMKKKESESIKSVTVVTDMTIVIAAIDMTIVIAVTDMTIVIAAIDMTTVIAATIMRMRQMNMVIKNPAKKKL